jgi:uncharacterized protein YggE
MRQILMILFCAFIYPLYGQTNETGEFIAVIGEATGTYIPDMITFHFSINIIEKKQAEAVQKLNEQSNLFIDKVTNLGINSKQIKLSNYNLEEAFDYSSEKSKSIGYEASEDFELEIKYSTEVFNRFIDSISNTKFKNLSFTYEQTFSDSLSNQIRNDLITRASDNAMEIAQTLAKSRQVKLGTIYSIEYTRNVASLYGVLYIPPPPPPAEMDYAADMKRPEISSRISIKGIEKTQQVRLVIRINNER